LIFKYEGRVNIGTFCILSLFIFFKNNKFIKNSLLIIFLFFLSIYISSIWENINKSITLEEDNKKSFSFYKEKLVETIVSFELKSSPTNRYAADGKNFSTKEDLAEGISQSVDNLTTGRSEKWKYLLNYEQNFKNIILGNGPEFDRYLLTRNNKITKKTTGTDSANSLIYVYLTGGLISLLMFIFLGINQLYIVLKIIIKKQFLNDKILNLSILCFIILGIRSVFENGLSVWGIDLILFMLFGSIINSRKINKNKL